MHESHKDVSLRDFSNVGTRWMKCKSILTVRAVRSFYAGKETAGCELAIADTDHDLVHPLF